jgi:hypothetical protein
MYARSTTVIVDPSSLDRAIALLNDEVMPALMRIDGCIGMSGLIERDTGRCIATSAWRSYETMAASQDQVAPVRNRLIDTLRARDPQVQEWEIPVMHRFQPAPDHAGARLSWLQGDPANIDNSIEAFKLALPELDNLPGFCSASLLIDRDTGDAVSTVVYDGPQSLAYTRDTAQLLRRRVAEQARAQVLEVSEFELALAHLRVPELV